MRKLQIFVILCTVFFIFQPACKSDGEESGSPPSKTMNIVVILDTSDRISKEKHPDQTQKDIEIVKGIVTQFEKLVLDHLAESPVIKYPHRLTFVVPDQPKVPQVPVKIMEKLTIEDSGEGNSYPEFEKQRDALFLAIDELYKFVEGQKQTGSDIWDWFRARADYYFQGNQNYIICLSDGYLNFDPDIEAKRLKRTFMQVGKLRNDPNWKEEIQAQGLLAIGRDLSRYNVKFLMVEIALRRDKETDVIYTQDFDIIKEYWETWLTSMGITNSKFIEQINPGILKKEIKAFLSQ